MELNVYQEETQKTVQKNASDASLTSIVPFLGIIGEIGSLVTELKKKFRDGDGYVAYRAKLCEELGDVLWYVATIAAQNDLKLEEVATKNLGKIHDRFLVDDFEVYHNFDLKFPKKERFPEEFEIEFISYSDRKKQKLKIINRRTGKPIGDSLTDNTYVEDGYRYHDIFHYGYLAVLGWSPVLRKLLKLKRKSDPQIDENEDGARAQIIEEMVSLYIYSKASDHELLKYSKSVDSGIIKQVQILVGNLEVRNCSGKQWEKAILNSYEIYNKLRDNNGGRVLVSKKNRALTYLGKK